MPYVESPLDRIVNVNFGAVGQTALRLNFSAALKTGGRPPPQYGEDDQFVMTVSTVNLPLLDRTTLMAPDEFFGGDNVFGSFPDGPPANPTGVINGSYSLGQSERLGPGEGGANYSTFSEIPFNRASSVAITITCDLRLIFADGDLGYNTSAIAVGQIKGGAELVQTLEGTAASGGTITLTATLGLATSVLSLVGS